LGVVYLVDSKRDVKIVLGGGLTRGNRDESGKKAGKKWEKTVRKMDLAGRVGEGSGRCRGWVELGRFWGVPVTEGEGGTSAPGSRNDVNRLGTWVGAMAQSNSDSEAGTEPPDSDCETVIRLARRLSLITKRFKEGGEYKTEYIAAR
jgi:hypothetical protein